MLTDLIIFIIKLKEDGNNTILNIDAHAPLSSGRNEL